MLEILILYIQATFRNSWPTSTTIESLAEQVRSGNLVFPSLYCENDEYKPISGDENFIYFRQTGAATEGESDEESVSGCDHYITRTYPMVAVGYIPKNIFNTDNAFVDSKISGNIANILRVANYGSLTASLKADQIHTEVKRISTDRYEVWEQEFKGIDMAARFDHVLCAVEFDLVVSATESCLRNYDCNDAQVTVEGDTITLLITDPSAWHKSGDVLATNKKLGSLNNEDWTIIHNGITVATIKATGLTLDVLNQATTDTDKFLVSDGGVVKYRTGAEIRADIGAGTGNGTVTVVGLQTGTSGTDVNITGSPVTGAGVITINIPDAAATARGLVTTGAQTFGGTKTFASVPIIAPFTSIGGIIYTDATGQMHQDQSLWWNGQQLFLYVVDPGIPRIRLTSINGSIATPGDTTINTTLGRYGFAGSFSGSGIGLGAQIEAISSQNWTNISCPAHLMFSTTPPGSTANTNLFFFTDRGSLQLGFSGADTNTFSLAFSNTSSGAAFYNTASTSAYERGVISFVGNEFSIASSAAGTGTARNIRISTARAALIIQAGTTSPVIDFDINSSGAITQFIRLGNGTLSNASSGNITIVGSSPTINPSSGGAAFFFHALRPVINQTGTSTGIVRGYYYAPTATSVLGQHIAFESTMGSIILGGTGVNSYLRNHRLTTAQRDALTNLTGGEIIFNTSTSKHQGYNGATWNDLY